MRTLKMLCETMTYVEAMNYLNTHPEWELADESHLKQYFYDHTDIQIGTGTKGLVSIWIEDKRYNSVQHSGGQYSNTNRNRSHKLNVLLIKKPNAVDKAKVIDELVRFQRDRGLSSIPYDPRLALTNIFEESLELVGINNRRQAEVMANEIVKQAGEGGVTIEKPKIVDALADIITFCVGEIERLSYDPNGVLSEVGKVVNSRVGVMKNGKFTKDTSEEAKANWYLTDYESCKYGND